jgi:fatty-acyl-CoA synthase
MHVPMSPLRFLHRTVGLYPEKAAVVCSGERFTYRAFGERVNRLSHALLATGVAPGDRVAYLGLNCHRLIEGYYGIPQIGAILLCVNIRLTPEEIAYIVNDAEPSVLLVSQVLAPVWDAIRDRCPSVRQVVLMEGRLPDRDWPSYEEWIAAQPATDPPVPEIDENDVAGLFYTSGTTAHPKGVMLTNRNIFMHAVSAIISLGYTERTSQIVGTVPLFHVNAWGSPHQLVAVAGTQIVVPRFDPEILCRAVQEERASWVFLVPTMLNALLNYPDIGDYDLSSLERIVLGGAPCPRTLIEAARARLHCECLVGYGMTETTPIATLGILKGTLDDLPQEEKDRRQAMTGIPVFAVDVEIFDDEDRPLPHDGVAQGEIRIRADSVMKGYWRQPEATEAVMRNGWFCTGDVATVDEEGYFNIVDRKKDIIISGGENISTASVEDALFRHPAVLEAAVIGIPHAEWGETPHAMVVRRPGMEVSEDDIIAFARLHLSGFKVPRSVEFVDELPKTGTGKIQKHVLRERYWAGRESRVL